MLGEFEGVHVGSCWPKWAGPAGAYATATGCLAPPASQTICVEADVRVDDGNMGEAQGLSLRRRVGVYADQRQPTRARSDFGLSRRLDVSSLCPTGSSGELTARKTRRLCNPGASCSRVPVLRFNSWFDPAGGSDSTPLHDRSSGIPETLTTPFGVMIVTAPIVLTPRSVSRALDPSWIQ